MICGRDVYSGRVFAIILLLAVFCLNPSARATSERFMPTGIALHLDISQMGMGGLTVAVPGSSHTVFYNPAGLNRHQFHLDVAPVSVGLDQDAIEVINFINHHQYEFDHFEDLDPQSQKDFIMASQKFDNKWVTAVLTPYIGLSVNDVGVGFYSVLHTDVKADQGVFFPAVGLRGYQDDVLGVGIGRTLRLFGSDYDFGATLRLVQRKTFKPIRVNADDANRIEKVISSAYDQFDTFQEGFGFDVGLMRSFPGDTSDSTVREIGIVIQDLAGELDGYVKPSVKIGASYFRPMHGFAREFLCGAEISDFFNRRGVGFAQRINLGAQLSILRKIVEMRVGVHEGYPTAGLGLKIKFIKIDYAYFTSELGARPGQFPESTHRLQLSLYFR